VSDFVSRVAARAVGGAAVARPRLPALFEPAGAVRGLEIVEEVVVRHPRSAAPPPPAAPSRQPLGSLSLRGAAPRPRPARPAAAAARTTAAPERTPAGRRDEALSPSRQRQASTPKAIVEELTIAEDPTVLLAAAAPRATVAAGPTALAKQPEPPEPQPPGSAPMPSPVRVHIGRLEVRANLQEPRRQPAAERPRPQELSLGDYLRGRRSTS
jgi:hypothetical protein